MTTITFKRGDHVRHRRHPGIAMWFLALDPDTNDAWVRMVGDDRDFTVDLDDLQPLNEDEFCGGCGQIGCGHA